MLLASGSLGCELGFDGDADYPDGHDFVDAGVSMDGGVFLDGSVADGSFGNPTRTATTVAPQHCPTDCDPRTPDEGCGTDHCLLTGTVAVCSSLGIGTGLEGTACTDTADCAGGLACALVEGTAQCARPCCEDNDCGVTDACTLPGVLAGATATDWHFCAPVRTCGLLHSDCDQGESCYVVSGTGDTQCLTAGNLGEGDACDHINSCGPSFSCVGAIAQSRCVQLCDLSQTTSCGGAACVQQPQTPSGIGLCQ